MPAQTRNGNKATTFMAYYTKKVPKQVYFPHKRKVVRDKPGTWESTSRQPRQLTFIPEKLRIGDVVRDSDGEDEDNEEELSNAEPEKEVEVENDVEVDERASSGRGGKGGRTRKRSSDVMQEDAHHSEGEHIAQPKKKRARQPAKKTKGSPIVKTEPAANNELSPHRSYASPSETDVEEDRRTRRRRQSTMTQLIEGRLPNDSDSEPEFQSIRRTLRRSNSNEKDQKQRTLTQMVPLLTLVPLMSDEEIEEEAQDGAYSDAIARRINNGAEIEVAAPTCSSSLPVADTESRPNLHTAVANSEDKDEEDEYHPSQHIPAPTLRRRQTPRRVSSRSSLTSPTLTNEVATPRKTPRSRFGLLATPERSRIREIPSSQSPPDTPLSTQVTTAHRRAPLLELSSAILNVQDSPSKRKKVMFSDGANTAPQSASKQRFFGAVRDSEDEDDDLEDLEQATESALGRNIGAESQMQINAIDYLARCKDAGAETQAELELINQACAWDDENHAPNDHPSPAGSGDAPAAAIQDDELSQELGTPWYPPNERDDEGPPSNQEGSSTLSADVVPAQHFYEETQPTLPLSTAPHQSSSMVDPADVSLAPETEPRPVVTDAEDSTTQKLPSQASAPFQHQPLTELTSTLELDLDGDPIQVRRSPPPNIETQETNRSFSSKAEQQLQLEWSTSQFPSAKRNASEEASAMPPPQWQPAPGVSQATTLDPTQWSPNVTPKKTQRAQPGDNATPWKTQRTPDVTPKSGKRSAIVTPHRIPNSQPFTSPGRPDTLVIPSSFPTPSKTMAPWGNDWTTPVRERTVWDTLDGSDDLDDFSIPAMPPMGDDGEEYEL